MENRLGPNRDDRAMPWKASNHSGTRLHLCLLVNMIPIWQQTTTNPPSFLKGEQKTIANSSIITIYYHLLSITITIYYHGIIVLPSIYGISASYHLKIHVVNPTMAASHCPLKIPGLPGRSRGPGLDAGMPRVMSKVSVTTCTIWLAVWLAVLHRYFRELPPEKLFLVPKSFETNIPKTHLRVFKDKKRKDMAHVHTLVGQWSNAPYSDGKKLRCFSGSTVTPLYLCL